LTTDGKSFEVEGDLYQCHDQTDTTPPTIIDVRATDLTHVELTFSEPVNTADAETESNYALGGGIGTYPSSAIQKADLRTVNLTTGTQTIGNTYSITINNIRDRATPANTIQSDTFVQFTGGKPTLQIIDIQIDPDDHSIVYLTTDVQSRIGYALSAYNIRDESGNNQPGATTNFIGGGYHLTLNQIYYDPAVTNDDDREWWEIFNPETNSINLKSWRFADDGNSFGLPADDLLIPQSSYASFAINGQTFHETYGYYPDFEVFGDTVAKTMSYTGTSRQPLGNTADYLEMATSYGRVYDAVVWGNKAYGSMTGYTAPDVAAGTSLARIIPGREGPEDVLASSPTGADEQSEKQNSGVFTAKTNPAPKTLDCQPPAIEDVQSVVGSVFATISWNTTEPGWPEINPEADSTVVYSTNPNPDAGANITVQTSEMRAEHATMLYPLTPNTDYYFYITATDGKGQTSYDKNGGSFYHFKTAPQDTTAPVISNILATPSDTTALITWDTDDLSSSTAYFGTSVPPGQVQTNLHLTTKHSVLLYGLFPSTEYQFSVVSMNPSGLSSTDDNSGSYYSFTTTTPVTMNYYIGSMDAFTSYSSGLGTPADAYEYANGGLGSSTDHLVISEVFFNQAGTDSATLCFVELYNPTPNPVTFTAGDPWYIKNIDGNSDSTLKTHTLNTGTIPAYGFFLVGGSAVSPTPDIVDGFDYQNGPDTIRLEHPDGVFIDVVGYEGTGARAAWTEGDNYETAPVPIPPEGNSIERRSGSPHDDGAGNQQDTGDNSQDFYARATPQPQNSASAIEMPPAGQGPDINVLGINDYSYQLSGAEYSAGKSEQALSTINGDFIALYGQQLWDGSEGYGKISAYDESVEEVASGLALYDLSSAFQWIIDHEAIGIFNSPGQGMFEDMAYDPDADQYMVAFELLDSSVNSPYEQNYNKGLKNGWHYGALAGQRNENGNWGNKVNAYSKIDMTMFRAPELTSASILESLRTLNYYAYEADTNLPPSTDPAVLDPIYLDFTVNGYGMGLEFTDSNPLDFVVTLDAINDFQTVELIEDGVVAETWGGTPTNSLVWEFTHTPASGHHYYYVRGTQSDGQASRFWSSPIWVHSPVLSLPNEAPSIHTVRHTPGSPMSTDDVVITAIASDPENAISKVQLWYSQDSAPYANILMKDDGISPDTVAGDGIYSAMLSAMPDGTNIHYYASVIDDAGLQTTSPTDAPVHFYSFYVGARVLINELYCNAYDLIPSAGAEESEFIEFFNPTGSAVDMAGWTIEAQRSSGVWAFPAAISTLAGGGYFVLARDSYYNDSQGGYRGDPQLVASPNRAVPDFEMFDGDDLQDDGASQNMVLASGLNKEIKLNNYDDTLILRNHLGTEMDAMEYGIDYSWVLGRPIYVSPENCSLTRDYYHLDTDDSFVDFTATKRPTPGGNVGATPAIHHVTVTPGSPGATETVNVSARITCSGAITATVRYRVNGGAFQTPVAMAPMGDNIFTGTLPAQPASSSVEYYVYASSGPNWDSNPVDDPSDGEVAVPPERLYSYTVWPHLVISEVYYNSMIYENPALNSKFIEIYNPDESPVNIGGWKLYGEPSWYLRKWQFPAGTVINGTQALVIAKTAGDFGTSGFYTEFGFYPDFEMYDATCSGSGYSDHDNPGVTNMILIADDNYDDQIELPGYPYYDAIYLYDNSVPELLVDAMEYGIEGENVPGMPASETEVGYSLTRDDMGTDTDNSMTDFFADTPSPGMLGVVTVTFDIPLQPTPGWNFISFPLGASGPMESVLDDLGGDTAWDVVKWYDGATKTWKTYRAGSGVNTLTNIDNTMGVWVHITDIGSDGFLTVEGSVPVSTSIYLHAGWNMVSYPSMTARPASEMLPGVADIVGVYQSDAPYVTDTTALGTVTMEAGNAYWVHCTADAPWVVAY
ncbi:MAG: lamin tail domain-containing protein, partial [Thermoplasmata archaeon]